MIRRQEDSHLGPSSRTGFGVRDATGKYGELVRQGMPNPAGTQRHGRQMVYDSSSEPRLPQSGCSFETVELRRKPIAGAYQCAPCTISVVACDDLRMRIRRQSMYLDQVRTPGLLDRLSECRRRGAGRGIVRKIVRLPP